MNQILDEVFNEAFKVGEETSGNLSIDQGRHSLDVEKSERHSTTLSGVKMYDFHGGMFFSDVMREVNGGEAICKCIRIPQNDGRIHRISRTMRCNSSAVLRKVKKIGRIDIDIFSDIEENKANDCATSTSIDISDIYSDSQIEEFGSIEECSDSTLLRLNEYLMKLRSLENDVVKAIDYFSNELVGNGDFGQSLDNEKSHLKNKKKQ